jgi:hypothetical protein
MIGLVALSQIGQVTTIQERSAPPRVVFKKPNGSIEIPTAPRSQGKLGWGFAADTRCTTYVIEQIVVTANRIESTDTKLVAYMAADQDAGVTVATSPSGLSSPMVSADGTTLLIVRGTDELVRLNIAKGSEIPLGSAWFGFWGADGLITTYTRRPDGCHLWRQLTAEGKTVKSVSQCGGYTVVPIASGIAPAGAPIPIVDISGNVVELLGAERGVVNAPVRLSMAERGAACEEGIDFVATDGRSVTLTKNGAQWSIRTGAASCSPVEERRGLVKVLSCGASP